MLSDPPTHSRRDPFSRFSLLALGLSVLLLSGCGPSAESQPPPSAATVPPLAPTQEPVRPQVSIPTDVRAGTAEVPPSPAPPSPAPPSSAPTPPRITRGDPLGDFPGFGFSLDFNDDYFLRMYVYRSDNPDTNAARVQDGQGIASVAFTIVSADGEPVYDRREENPGYCVFGGGEPDCNPWIFEGGQYKWRTGGDPVQPGTYEMYITVTATDDSVGQWFWNLTNENPIIIEVSPSAHSASSSDPEGFVRDYFATISSGDYGAAWGMLSDGFKSKYNSRGYGPYEDWWSTVDSVDVLSVEATSQDADQVSMEVELSYLFENGDVDPYELMSFTLVHSASTDGWIIEDAYLIRGSP